MIVLKLSDEQAQALIDYLIPRPNLLTDDILFKLLALVSSVDQPLNANETATCEQWLSEISKGI